MIRGITVYGKAEILDSIPFNGYLQLFVDIANYCMYYVGHKYRNLLTVSKRMVFIANAL
ncbi:hypothetical protein D1872_166520 [compost metagenome]